MNKAVWCGLSVLAGVTARAEKPAPDMDALMKAVGGAMQQASATPTVDFRELKALLPEKIGDMKRTSAKGQKNSAMGVTVAEATGEYKGAGEASGTVKLVDMGGMGGLGALAGLMGEIDNESDTGYEKSYMRNGVKILEKYDSNDRSGGISAFLGRFQVVIELRGVKAEQLKAALDAVDLKKLAALKPAPKKAE